MDPTTGEILRVTRGGNWVPAGHPTWNGYIMISLALPTGGHTKIRAHHLVWVWATGAWPKNELDHINGDRADNHIENLREATVSQNRTNKIIQRNNKSGFKWVYRHPNKRQWYAEIAATPSMGMGRKRLHYSVHDTAKEAHEAACGAAREIFGPWFNPG